MATQDRWPTSEEIKEESLRIVVSLLTDTQLLNMARKVWDSMTEGSGYQPFGYDRPTMSLTHPEHLNALDVVREEIRSRDLIT